MGALRQATASAASGALRRAVASVLVCALALCAACGSRQKKPKPPAEPKLTLSIQSQEDTNAGRPMHVVVRSVDFKTFVEQSYQEVAALVVAPDASVLTTFIVFPGSAHQKQIPMPEKGPVAVYFLFTEPGNPWKRLIEEPLPNEIAIVLEQNQIVEPEDSDDAASGGKKK